MLFFHQVPNNHHLDGIFEIISIDAMTPRSCLSYNIHFRILEKYKVLIKKKWQQKPILRVGKIIYPHILHSFFSGLTVESIQQCFWRGMNLLIIQLQNLGGKIHTIICRMYTICPRMSDINLLLCFLQQLFSPLLIMKIVGTYKWFTFCCCLYVFVLVKIMFLQKDNFIFTTNWMAGFVCVRGFDRRTRAPRPLMARLHLSASRVAKQNKQGKKPTA